MTIDRPVCIYALNGLKKNSTQLLITICIGLALSLYGIYVQARSSSPGYRSSIATASNWLMDTISHKLAYSASMLAGCHSKAHLKRAVPTFFSRYLIRPVIYKSGFMNAIISLVQMVLLKLYCRNIKATSSIIALSCVGICISAVCFFGALATCKTVCISCLSIHHGFVIYFALRRRAIISNMLCPPGNTNEGACTFGTPSNYGNDRSPNKSASKPKVNATKAANDAIKRRSNRL